MMASNPEGPSPEVQKSVDILRQYVEQGGGLFITNGVYWANEFPTTNALLAVTGARMRDELVRDDQNLVKLKSGINLCWTDALAQSPLTEGVSGLFYGADF